MIKAVEITNYLGESKRLVLDCPEESGLAVTDITGLGPSKSNIYTTEVITTDGAIYNGARTEARNIVFSLRFLPFPDIESTRHESYKYFPLKKRVGLVIETDSRICETYGYVESNEPDIFSKKEISQISIICPDPYLYSVESSITIFYGIEHLFEFPFFNDSLSEKLILMGVIREKFEQSVFYNGDAEVGIVLTLHALGDVSNITIYNIHTRETMMIDTDKLQQLTGAGMGAGDDVIITTIKGEKSMVLLRDGHYTNILNCMNKASDWFELAKGYNLFGLIAESGMSNLVFTIENRIAYEGV